MSGRDRTKEFLTTIQRRRQKPQWIQQQQKALEQQTNNVNHNRLANDPQYREFMRISRECSFKIGNSCDKLRQLTQLARQKTVFDDGQLGRLIGDIRDDISQSKSQLDYLQTKYQPKQKHSENIVTTLQQRLANITSDFKSALEIRSQSIQEQNERQERYSRTTTATSALDTSTHSRNPNKLTPNALQLSNAQSNGPVFLDMGAGPSSAIGSTGVYDMNPQQMQLQQTLLHDDQMDLTERADKMHMIESTIVELGTVFNQLAQMVQTQGETITRIDMNISETTDNVEAAHDALLSYLTSINSNRWLILKVFGILFLFFILFVVFAV